MWLSLGGTVAFVCVEGGGRGWRFGVLEQGIIQKLTCEASLSGGC